MKRLAFLASYNGSSARAITEACRDGTLNAAPILIISNNAKSTALQWAADNDLKNFHVNGNDEEIINILQNHDIDLIVLSRYMNLIGPEIVQAFPNKILNIHPALLPKYGGQGMYGRNVHEAVKAAGDLETGITIHYVDEIYDNGTIIAQKKISLKASDSVDEIEQKVRAAEPGFYTETLQTLL